MTFTANGEYLVSGGDDGVRVWQVKDGEQVATMQAKDVRCVAVSKDDGNFIAVGSLWGDVLVWDTGTYEQFFADKIPHQSVIYDVDFAPNSSRLVSANNANHTAVIWDIGARKKVQTLDHHGQSVEAAKYSPQGDRIATAGLESVQVSDSDDGQLLVEMKAGPSPWRGLRWFNNYLFVKTWDSKIKKIDESTGLTLSEWSVPHEGLSYVALPQHGKFIAYSTKDNITFWDTLTHTQLGFISRSTERRSIAFSPDHRLAIVSREKNIIIKTLSLVKV